jgi:chromosome partitioning protein
MANVFCVCLRKGGSGKTTTSVNLAAGLHMRGRRVLLIDLDDQANATMCVGINPFDLTSSVSTLFTDISANPQDVMVQTNFGFSVLPASQDLERVAAGMTAQSIGSLRPIVEALDNDFDDIIIDTQPGHSYLSLSALVASQWAIIPLQTHYLALEGVARIMEDITKVQNGLNKSLSVMGIVPVMVQPNTNMSQLVLSQARENYSDLLLPINIRLSVKFVNASLEGVPLIISDPKHPGSREYMALVDFILQRLEAQHA